MKTHPCLGLVAAFEPEAALVRRQLRLHHKTVCAVGTLWQGRLYGQEVALLRCGMGAARATPAVTWLAYHCRLWGVISVGFAGGLQRPLITGDAILVAQVRAAHSDQAAALQVDTAAIEPDGGLARLASMAAAQAALARHTGMLLSAAELVPQAVDKQYLGQQSGALAIDMESYSIGCVAAAHHLPFMVLRTIFDTSDEDLSLPVGMFTTPDGMLQPMRLAAYCARHPRTLTQLPHLWHKARVAGRHLEVWLYHFFTLLRQQQS